MRGENGKESLINGRAANCPGFPRTVPNFEPCPGCPGKRLNVPDSRGLNFKRKLTKIVIKLAKIHISKAINLLIFLGVLRIRIGKQNVEIKYI